MKKTKNNKNDKTDKTENNTVDTTIVRKKRKNHAGKLRKTSRNKNTVWIHAACMLAGIAVFVFALVAPKTILAMMDHRELNTLYVREVDTELAAESEAISVEEKLALLCEDDANVSVSAAASAMDEQSMVAFNKKTAKMAEDAIRELQDRGIMPEIDLGIYDEDTCSYYRLSGAGENRIYFGSSCDYFSVVSLDNMNQYVSLAEIIYAMDDEYLTVLMDTDTGVIYEFIAEVYVTEEEYVQYEQDNGSRSMQEYLGISDSAYREYYYRDVINMTDIEYDESKGEIQMDLYTGLMKSSQTSTVIMNSLGYQYIP